MLGPRAFMCVRANDRMKYDNVCEKKEKNRSAQREQTHTDTH